MGLAAFNKMRKLRANKERLEAEKAKETEKKELIYKLEKEQREKALALALKEKDAQLQNEDEVDIKSLKVEELKELAKEKGIEGYDDMKKAELLEVLKG